MARLRFFAGLREAAGRSADVVEAASIGELLEITRGAYGEEFARALNYCRVAVNGTFVDELEGDATGLVAEDEVAFLPPVSGG